MAKVFDIKTGKEKPPVVGYIARKRLCMDRSAETGQPCDCPTCRDKKILAKQVLLMSKRLCVDYCQQTGNTLYSGDWFEIVVTAANNLKEYVYPKTQENMGRKNHNMDREFDDIQRLKHENKELRRKVAKLQKEMRRLNDRYSNLDDLVQEQYEETEQSNDDLKKKWQCHACKSDYLRIVIFNRPDGTFYFRKCGSCINRTKLQRYSEKVEGIVEDVKKD